MLETFWVTFLRLLSLSCFDFPTFSPHQSVYLQSVGLFLLKATHPWIIKQLVHRGLLNNVLILPVVDVHFAPRPSVMSYLV